MRAGCAKALAKLAKSFCEGVKSAVLVVPIIHRNNTINKNVSKEKKLKIFLLI